MQTVEAIKPHMPVVAIGPFGLGLFSDSSAILHVAELGVVMFLFIEPER